MADDDWTPLGADQVASHPGEFVVVQPRPVPDPATADPLPPPPPPVPLPPPAGRPAAAAHAPAPPPPVAPPDPAAVAAFAALQAKVAAAPRSASFVAAAVQREAKAARRARAAATPALQDCKPMAVAAPPLPVAYAADGTGRDPREDQPWFQALPAAERERLHGVWAQERTRHQAEPVQRARSLWRAMADGAFVMAVLGVLQSLLVGGFHTVLLLAGAGAVAAGLAQTIRPERFTYAIAGGLAWFAVMLPYVMGCPYLMPGILFAAYGLGAVGMAEEMRRSGGFRD